MRQIVEHLRRDEASLVVTCLGPGIGKQHEHPPETRIGQGVNDLTSIVLIDPDIVQVSRGNFRQQFRHSGDIRLGANDPDFGIAIRLRGQMFTAAKPDFQPHIAHLRGSKIELRICPVLRIQQQPRKQCFQQPRLMGAEGEDVCAPW